MAFASYFLTFANQPRTPQSRDKNRAFLGEATSQQLDAAAAFSATKDILPAAEMKK